MTKQEVIQLITNGGSGPSYYVSLKNALAQAPAKNLSLISHYNRQAYSAQRLNTLVYDVKKAWSIKDADLKAAPKAEAKQKLKPEAKSKVNSEDWTSLDLSSLDYRKELKPLAAQVAEQSGDEPKSQKKADLIAFLKEKKSEETSGME